MASVELSGLSGGAPDHPVGRQSSHHRHPHHAVPEGGPRSRRARRRRSIRAGRRWHVRPICSCRCGPAPISPSPSRCTGISSSKAMPTPRFLPSTPPARSDCARRPSRGHSSAPPKSAASACEALRTFAEMVRGVLARAGQVRLGPRAQSQWRQRRSRDPGVAGGGRQVRRPRRRLLDEQLGVMESSIARGSPIRNRQRARST